jgi:hypothetical protein
VTLGSEDRSDLAQASVRVGELDDSHDRGLFARLDLKALASDAPALGLGDAVGQRARDIDGDALDLPEAAVSAADLWMNDFGFNVYEIGLRVAEALFNIELNVGNASKLKGAVRYLEATFFWKTAIDELLTRLTKSDRKHWYPVPGASEQEFTALLASLRDLAGYVSAAHGRVPDIRRGHASQKMGLVLSQWVKDLTGSTPEGIDLAPVAWLPDMIDLLAGEGKTPAEIDKNLATELRYHGADDPEKYHAKAPYAGALLLGNVIPIWEWVGGFIDLNELD